MIDKNIKKFLIDTVRTFIPDREYSVFLFGSRATQTNRAYSDVDLGIMGPSPISPKQYIQIQDALENSDLPYKVDIVDFSEVSEHFKTHALRSTINL